MCWVGVCVDPEMMVLGPYWIKGNMNTDVYTALVSKVIDHYPASKRKFFNKITLHATASKMSCFVYWCTTTNHGHKFHVLSLGGHPKALISVPSRTSLRGLIKLRRIPHSTWISLG